MKNFNWNNFIGEHMDEPLKITHYGRNCYGDVLTKDFILNYDVLKKIANTKDCFKHHYKPRIKSTSDLTDDEWLFVFWDKSYKKENKSDYEILRYKEHGQVSLHKKGSNCCSNSFYLDWNEFEDCNQMLLNNLYSLHVSLDYEELIKNNKAVRKP